MCCVPHYHTLPLQEEFTAALAGAGDRLVVVDYTASWCDPCQFLAPIFEVATMNYDRGNNIGYLCCIKVEKHK